MFPESTPPPASILIAEDEAIIAADLEDLLGGMGYGVIGPVATGADALHAARATRPSLALLDIRLRGSMDGIALATTLRQELDLPAIFLTAHSDQATLDRAQLTESFGYLLKPFDERLLKITIEMAIYKHRMEQERALLTRELASALAEVKTLRGFLSICCRCHRIADETGHWARMESYVSKRTHANFSHTFCPVCNVNFYEENGIPVPQHVLDSRAEGRFDP